MHDDDAVSRKMDVEFQTVGAKREAVVERGDRVFGRQGAAPAMREHERAGRGKECMAHGAASL